MNKIDIGRLDLNLVKSFDAMMKTRSVTRAARMLHIGQPAMSHSLARLREVLDDELFVRSAAGMQPTRRALEVSGPLRRAIIELESAFNGSAKFDPAVDEFEFTVALSDYSECALLPTLMHDLAKAAPNFCLRVRQFAMYSFQQLLDENDIDLVLAGVQQSAPWQSHELLFTDTRKCVYSKRQLKLATPISLDDYLTCRHVLITKNGERTTPIDDELARQGLSRKVGLITPRFSTLPALLSRAPLIATLPGRVSYVFEKHKDLVVSELPFDAPTIKQSMAWHCAASGDPAFSWFLERVRASVRAPV